MVDNQLKLVKKEVREKEVFIEFLSPEDSSEAREEISKVTNELAILEKEVRNHYKKL